MAIFWIWGVRNLFVALAGVVAFAGYRGVADWSITFTVMLGLAMVAEVGSRLGRRAVARKHRKAAAVRALHEASVVRDRLRTAEQRRAA